ncbi:hypothetical protein ACJMK2_034868 [Sinanodonta woodiana]|uniref:G-protein coupled receptors family 1 profile domain-containing protein n=1 Tax=Sinanodonta woodiana TaxID=1069815 RepID=A0ABD3WV53_SINWO
MVPWAVYFTLEEHHTGLQTIHYCYENWPSEKAMKIYFLAAIFLCCYSVPLSLIVFCYSLIGIKVWRRHAPGVKNTSMGIVHKSKVKAVQMLSVVVILFAFSWLPMYAIRLHSYFGTGTTSSLRQITEVIFPIAQWLGSSNSAMNPIIYCFFSKKFRTGFKDAITCCATRRMDISRRSGIIRRAATVSLSNGTCYSSTPTMSVRSNNYICRHTRSEDYL